jgi:hypothetical protein
MDFTSAGAILTFSWLGALYGTSLEDNGRFKASVRMRHIGLKGDLLHKGLLRHAT